MYFTYSNMSKFYQIIIKQNRRGKSQNIPEFSARLKVT